ncbi:MAG: MoaD/ThiS family protein [Betaproteobacteria bacterium]
MTARPSHEAATVVHVRIPSPLRSYTGAADVRVAVPVLAPELPPTIRGVLAALDLNFPGIRFRIIDEQGRVRPHIKLFVGRDATRDLSTPIPAGDPLMIVAALSGG